MIVRGTPPASTPSLPLDVAPTTPDPLPASATLVCHINRYLTFTNFGFIYYICYSVY